MEKNNCYIFWDNEEIAEADRAIYVQCEDCFKKNKKGFKWSQTFMCGRKDVKCNLCNTIIYTAKKKKKKGDDATTI